MRLAFRKEKMQMEIARIFYGLYGIPEKRETRALGEIDLSRRIYLYVSRDNMREITHR